MHVVSLHRYPVKGLSPERRARLDLTAGGHVPGDRLFAIENGPASFDPAAPQHQPKIKFLMLMRDEALVRLRTRYLDDTTTLVIEHEGREAVRADLSSPEGRLAVEAFVRRFMPGALRGPPKVLTAPDGFRFTDSRRGHVSIINRASVGALEASIGRPVDPLRFRGNVLVDGLAPWAEFDLVGQEIRTGAGLVLKVTKRIVRCAATEVDPVTAARDLDIVGAIDRLVGHRDLGIYAEVMRSGTLSEGDRLEPVAADQGRLPLEG